jgi:hypothetical protein
MSDFDAVLERLVTDPGFKAALAADPARALAGYRLSPDEVELLHAQVDTGAGGNRQVEQRTSKASLFGLLSPLAGAAGFGGAPTDVAPGSGSDFGSATQGYDLEIGQGISAAASHAGFTDMAHSGFGDVAQAGFGDGAQFGLADAGQGGVGAAAQAGFDALSGGVAAPGGGTGGLLGHNLDAVQSGPGGFGSAPPPPGYHPHIDVDGDGHWDKYTVVARSDGGVDVVADMNRDGRADFVGHDLNRDGLIDSADYDEDRDGTFETHMRDVNGDGWMDTRQVDPQPPASGSSAVGRHRLPDGEGFGPA